MDSRGLRRQTQLITGLPVRRAVWGWWSIGTLDFWETSKNFTVRIDFILCGKFKTNTFIKLKACVGFLAIGFLKHFKLLVCRSE